MITLHEGSTSTLVERVREIFSPTGRLSKAKNFEYRAEQQEMAVAVAEALASRSHLVVEAGTGVGKSLAYLVPAILHALEHKRKAIVSTYTINLQEQLVYKDLPILQKALEQTFDSILWKGRQNYVCPMRLQRAMSSAEDLFTSTEQQELARIWRDEDVTTILVTHDLEEAIYLADRILILPREKSAEPRLIDVNLARPRDRSAAEFVRLREELLNLFGLH